MEMRTRFLVTSAIALLLGLIACNKAAPPPKLGGRTGNLNEALSSPEAFAQIRGAGDMGRIPFWFPVQLLRIRNAWDLCEGAKLSTVIAADVVEIGWTTNVVFGRCTGDDGF